MGKMKTADVGNTKNKEKQHEAHKAEENKVHLSGLKGGARVKVVGAPETEEVASPAEGELKRTESKKSVEKIRSQKYKDAKAKIDKERFYKLEDAVKLVKEASYSKFDGTMELHMIVKKVGASAQVALPFVAGRQKKVEVASDETVAKLKEGKIDFDVLVSTMEMMPKLVPFARLLGPKGLMPNAKNGTLVNDIKKANSFSTSTVTLKTEKEAPLVHTVVGKNSQKDEEIIANLEAIFRVFGGSKQIIRAYIKSSMSPSVKVEVK